MGLVNKLKGFREILYFDNWPQLLLKNTFSRSNPIQVYKKRGLNMVSDKSKGDVTGLRSVIASPMYRVFLEHLQLPAQISLLDIGANVGGFALMLKLNGHDPVHYVGVEMHPDTFSRLSGNIKNNLAGNITLLNKAVYSENGSIHVSFTGGGTGESVADAKTDGGTEIATVTVNSLLNEYFPGQNIDLCKIDIEGSEYEIFFSHAFSEIKRAKYILIEIHPHTIYTKEELITSISNQDFVLVKEFEDVYLFKNEMI